MEAKTVKTKKRMEASQKCLKSAKLCDYIPYKSGLEWTFELGVL